MVAKGLEGEGGKGGEGGGCWGQVYEQVPPIPMD